MQKVPSQWQVEPSFARFGIVRLSARSRPCVGTDGNDWQSTRKTEAPQTPRRSCYAKAEASRRSEGTCTVSSMAAHTSAPGRPRQVWRSLTISAMGCLLCCMLACALAPNATAAASSSISWNIEGMLRGEALATSSYTCPRCLSLPVRA